MAAVLQGALATGHAVSIADFGAIPGDRLQTTAIQAAVDAVWRAGGGEVRVPAHVVALPGRQDVFASAHGVCPYTIVVPDDLGYGGEFLLKDFRSLLEKATGVELPVVKTNDVPSSHRIFLGIAPSGADVSRLADQEHCVLTQGDDVYLFGGGRNGTRYAAYSFLQKDLGFRFFDTHGGVKVPECPIPLPKVKARRQFPFKFRYLCGGSGMFNLPSASTFLLRHGQNTWVGLSVEGRGVCDPADEGRILPPHAHALRYYLPADKKERTFGWIGKLGGPDLKVEHPEYFSMNSAGKRVFNHQYCLSNPGCRKLLKERILENMRRHPECNIFDVSAGDTPGQLCHCQDCQALVGKYGTVGAPLVDFLFELCPAVKAEFPENRVMSLVYRKQQTQPPPKGIDRLPENFMPNFAPIDDNFAKDWTDPSNTNTLADLKTWCRLCADAMVWYYPNPYSGHVTPPFGNVERTVVDLKLMKEAGVTAHLWEHNVGVPFNLGFSELETYVYVRLMNDLSLDWRALADEFIDFEYGAAAALFKAYWREQEELRKTTPMSMLWNPGFSAYRHLTPERMAKWDRDFDRMEALVKDDPVRSYAIRRVRVNLDYAILRDYQRVKKCGFALPIDDLAERILKVVRRVSEDYCSKGFESRRKEFVKKMTDGVTTEKLKNRVVPKPLPADVFGAIPETKLFETIPAVFRTPYEDDPDAAYGIRAVFTANKKGAKLPLISGFDDMTVKKHFVLSRIGRDMLPPRGEYRFYEIGPIVLTLDCLLRCGEDEGYDFKADVSRAWEFGSFNRATGWISLKFEGASFYPEDAGKPDRVFADRIVVVKE